MNNTVRKMITQTITVCLMFMFTTGCMIKYIPDNWYNETIEFYRKGFETGWANEKESLPISDEQKDPNNKFGYLLRDLDGDGANELLIGLMDDSEETKFTDIYIWHSDRGSFRIMSTGEGYYMYLCPDNVIREDSWYGSQTKVNYMTYDSKNNAFLHVDGGGKPGKYELTPFM
jgi:hypothetical protein